MRNKIFVLCVLVCCFLSLKAFSSDVKTIRYEISDSLNTTVMALKAIYHDLDTVINFAYRESEDLKNLAEELSRKSQLEENNPTLLEHAKTTIPKCDYLSNNIAWQHNKWTCQQASLLNDCQPAPDEYRYLDDNGNYVCSKTPEGDNLNQYWKFIDYIGECKDANVEKRYGCFYKNKLNQEVQIDDSYCQGMQKPIVEDKVCQVAPSYSCQAYGPGWNREGKYCYKMVYQCKYSNTVPKYMIKQDPIYVNNQLKYYCSLEWYPKVSYKAPSLSTHCMYMAYDNVVYEAKKQMQANHFEVCSHQEQRKDALPLCPKDYIYNNETEMCHPIE